MMVKQRRGNPRGTKMTDNGTKMVEVWQRVDSSLGMATFAEGPSHGSWEAWADGGKMLWNGTYFLDPKQNFVLYVATDSEGRDADGITIKGAIRHLVNPLPPEPEPEPEPAVDWDRLETEAYGKYIRMFRA